MIEKPQDSPLIQHTMRTADRGTTEPLGNKNQRRHTHCSPVFVKHTSTPAVSVCWAALQLCRASPADILESTQFPQHFHPQWCLAHINQLQIPWLIVFGQSASSVCYKQMPVGSAFAVAVAFAYYATTPNSKSKQSLVKI